MKVGRRSARNEESSAYWAKNEWSTRLAEQSTNAGNLPYAMRNPDNPLPNHLAVGSAFSAAASAVRRSRAKCTEPSASITSGCASITARGVLKVGLVVFARRLAERFPPEGVRQLDNAGLARCDKCRR
jgi:hypothetical protein